MNSPTNHPQALSSSHGPDPAQLKLQELQEEESLPSLPKNRQWNEEEHILYLLFLEMNRERIKSKLLRRSNSFYKDMSLFIKTKTPVQCRSHNQKYEDRYRYPHRIIREEKEKVSPELYSHLALLSKCEADKLQAAQKQRAQFDMFTNTPPPAPKEKASFACQTDIKGVEVVFLMARPAPPLPEQPAPAWYYSQWMGQQQWQYPQMRWFY